ncbi:hypothetical protein [Gordonia aurantiaca]|uniref:hypothetical protein n=1 Tax=Gordonia sp. B21 TaxID=3151852 RepID=UPI003267874C
MNLSKRSKILITVVGFVAILGVLAQATGVLAAWNDKVFGGATFGKAPATDGYARSATAKVYTNRVLTSDSFEATIATHTFASPGSSFVPGVDGWTTKSKSGLFASGVVRGTGRSAASYTRNAGNTSASAVSLAKDLEIIPRSTAFDPSDRLSLMDTTGEYRAAVTCETDDYGRTVNARAEAPSGSPIEIGIGSNHYYSVPGRNQQVVINDDAVGLHVSGTLTSVVREEPTYALSTLVLDIDIQSALWPYTTLWTVTMQFVRAECGIGKALPAVDSDTTLTAARMAMARLAPTSESTPSESAESSASESSASSGSSADSSAEKGSGKSENSSSASSSDSEVAPAAKVGPTTPTDVDVGAAFPVTGTDGTDLGSATIQKVESTAESATGPATVAVKMSVTTSDATGASRLSTVDRKDFLPIVGGAEQDPGTASDTPTPRLPDTLEPGQTYSGWVTFTAPSAAGKAMWKPAGTAGFTFVLPDPQLPATSTTTPAPTVTAPETREPDAAPAPAEEKPAADAEVSEAPEPEPTVENKSRPKADSSSADSSLADSSSGDG